MYLITIKKLYLIKISNIPDKPGAYVIGKKLGVERIIYIVKYHEYI